MASLEESFAMDHEYLTMYINRFLKCAVCDDIFTDTSKRQYLLPCLHYVCSVCLQASPSANGSEEIQCSKCKEIYNIKAEDVGKFPEDTTREQAIFKVKQTLEKIDCQQCSIQKGVSFYCKKCSKYMCSGCHDDHMTHNPDHNFYSFPETNLPLKNENCKVRGHEEEKLDIFCAAESCKRLICRKCVSSAHRVQMGHVISSIDNIYQRNQKEMSEEKLKAKSSAKELDKKIDDVNKEIFQIEHKRKSVSENIRSGFEKEAKELKLQETNLKGEVENFFAKQLNILQELDSSLRDQKHALEDCVAFSELSLLSTEKTAFLQIAPIIKHRFEDLHLHCRYSSRTLPQSPHLDREFRHLNTKLKEKGITLDYSSNISHTTPLYLRCDEDSAINTDFTLSDMTKPQHGQELTGDIPDTNHFTFGLDKQFAGKQSSDEKPRFKSSQVHISGDVYEEDEDETNFMGDFQNRREKDKPESDANTDRYPVFVVRGELHKEVADVLVNTTSTNLDLCCGSVSKSLLKTAGRKLREECRKLCPFGLEYGKFIVTDGYNLKCKKVYHGALPQFEQRGLEFLKTFMLGCLLDASASGMFSICFPALGTGTLKYPKEQVAQTMFDVAEKFFNNHGNLNSSVKYIKFIVYPGDAETCLAFENEEKKRKSSS